MKMKINAANNQEKKDYLAYLPLAMRAMRNVANESITIQDIHSIHLISQVKKSIIISNSFLQNAKTFGTEENKMMNYFSRKYLDYTIKVVKM